MFAPAITPCATTWKMSSNPSGASARVPTECDGSTHTGIRVNRLTTGTCAGGGSGGGETRRMIRVFGGGTYFEWAASNRATNGATHDGFWYDTTMRAAGHTLTFVAFECGESFGITSYGYTASVDEFTYFAYANNADGAGILQTVVRYRRTCWR